MLKGFSWTFTERATKQFKITGETKSENVGPCGRIFQDSFHKKCFSLAWIFKLHKACQSEGLKGRKRMIKVAGYLMSDLTENLPEGEGDQVHLSTLGCWEIWID
ncbi:hypothetical protein SLA2020_283710 [Shorea laevis]